VDGKTLQSSFTLTHYNGGMSDFFNSLFEPAAATKGRWTARVGVIILYLIGLAAWGWFLGWGQSLFTFHDWGEITMPRLAYLKNALQMGVLPLHISDTQTLAYVTDRFWSVPDQLLSPQILLLPFFPLPFFVLINVWLLYTAGFLGLVWFGRKYQLSLFTFAVIHLLFNFNGHILAHYTAGHATWGGYFLFPWFVILVIELVQNKAGWAWISKISFLLFIVFLQGSYHQFVGMLIFLGLLVLAVPRHFWVIFKAGLFSILVSMFRVLPPFLSLNSFKLDYQAGYPTVLAIWDSLVQSNIPGNHENWNGLTRAIGNWEFTIYIGLLAAVFLIYFGIMRTFQNSEPLQCLLAPVTGIVLLSMDDVYRYIRIYFPLPLFTGERAPARMLSLAFVFVLLLAAVQFQRWLNEKKFPTPVKVTLLLLGLMEVQGLWENFNLWQVAKNATVIDPFYPFDRYHWQVANHHDDKYLLALALGLLITLVSSGWLIYRWRKEKLISTG